MSGTLTRSEKRLDVLRAVQPACVLRAPLFRQWGFQRKSILLKHIVRPRARSVELPYRSYRARLLVNTPLESVMFVLIDDCATGEGAARYRCKAMGKRNTGWGEQIAWCGGRFPYAEGGTEKYSTSRGVPKKIF